jgi:ribosome-associated protein
LATRKPGKSGGSKKDKPTRKKPSVGKGRGSKYTASRRPREGRPARADGEEGRELALAIAGVGLDKKALNIEIIDVRGKVDYSDYVVVMSGRSDRQVLALAEHVLETLSREHGQRCLGVEGMPHGSWVLMDYGDVVVHVFHEDVRGYYDLESLWLDAARVSVG